MPDTPRSGLARIASVDVLRGLACVLMAIDHVRVYSGLPAGGPTAGIFLTRWVTHFVAPAFCFFAGTAAWLLGRRLADLPALRRFLVSRGLLLVLLEFTLIRFLWSGTVGTDFMLAGVIWMLGWCMVLLAAFVSLTPMRAAVVGTAIVVLQPLFALPLRALPDGVAAAVAPWWEFIYPAGGEAAFGINVLYVLVPWVGVMVAGYGFGGLLDADDATRRRWTLRLGLGMTVLFVLVAAAVALTAAPDGDGPARPLWMRLLDQRKYPASVPFLLMTVGPLVALVPWAERAKGWWVRALDTFGRVPMWYYLLHLAVIHLAAIAVTAWRTGSAHGEWFATAPYTRIPPEGTWSLGLLYLVWALCIVALYPLCAWYARRKATRPSPWMRYL